MLSIFRRLMKNTDGATAVEYTLITSLIAVAAIASMRSVSGKVSHVLGAATNALKLTGSRRPCRSWECSSSPAAWSFWRAFCSWPLGGICGPCGSATSFRSASLLCLACGLSQAGWLGELSPLFLGTSVACAAGLFGVGAVAFANGMIGGGDVKFLAAVGLFAGPAHVVDFMLVTALVGGVLGLALLAGAPIRPVSSRGDATLRNRLRSRGALRAGHRRRGALGCNEAVSRLRVTPTGREPNSMLMPKTILAAFFATTLASAAVAQSPATSSSAPRSSIDIPATPGGPEFRDPKTGQIWTPQNVGRGPIGKPTPADLAFDPLAQAARIEGRVVQRPAFVPVGWSTPDGRALQRRL